MNQTENGQNTAPLCFRSHTAHLLAVALPFLQPAYRQPLELAIKFLEFSETIKLYQESHPTFREAFFKTGQEGLQNNRESGLFGLINTFVLDLEGLLCSLAQVCTGDEKEVISMFLNLIRAKHFYENYGDVLKSFLSSAMPTESADPPEPQMSGSPFSSDSSSGGLSMPDMASLLSGGNLTSLLNEEQTETLNLLKSLFENE